MQRPYARLRMAASLMQPTNGAGSDGETQARVDVRSGRHTARWEHGTVRTGPRKGTPRGTSIFTAATATEFGFARTSCGPSSSPHFCAEDCAAGSSSAMFGRRNMARTTDVCVWGGMCTAKKMKKMLRDDHHDKTGVKLCLVHLREGGLPPGRLGGLFFFASLRSLYIPLRFLADLRREICKKFLRGVRAAVGKADSPLKNAAF
ncbi:hypothetical protein ECC02_004544 [Trypanosoma cruzi]|uniref:Uncharacterized protein n=1 Tax=Trypanosoma cruzi TaxID=5693 RepID=A0A7J6Y7G7_TRYCR|nr:hypothetical protein ECC02_004544 [Trypanosoma cruzi]